MSIPNPYSYRSIVTRIAAPSAFRNLVRLYQNAIRFRTGMRGNEFHIREDGDPISHSINKVEELEMGKELRHNLN